VPGGGGSAASGGGDDAARIESRSEGQGTCAQFPAADVLIGSDACSCITICSLHAFPDSQVFDRDSAEKATPGDVQQQGPPKVTSAHRLGTLFTTTAAQFRPAWLSNSGQDLPRWATCASHGHSACCVALDSARHVPGELRSYILRKQNTETPADSMADLRWAAGSWRSGRRERGWRQG